MQMDKRTFILRGWKKEGQMGEDREGPMDNTFRVEHFMLDILFCAGAKCVRFVSGYFPSRATPGKT
jgi:hypothetical protein